MKDDRWTRPPSFDATIAGGATPDVHEALQALRSERDARSLAARDGVTIGIVGRHYPVRSGQEVRAYEVWFLPPKDSGEAALVFQVYHLGGDKWEIIP